MPSPGNPSSPSTSSATPAITPTSSGNAEVAVAAAVVAAVAAVAAAVLAAAVPVAAVPVAAAAAAAGKLAIPFDHHLSFNSLRDGEVSAGQRGLEDSLHMFGIDQGLFVFFSCIDAHPAVVLQAAVPRAAPLLATVAVDLRHRTVPRFPFPTSPPKSPSVAAAGHRAAVPRPAAGHRQAAHRPAAHRPPASFPLSPGFHGPGLGV